MKKRKKPTFQKVNTSQRSSRILAVQWENELLSLTFKGDKVYEYKGVPLKVAEELLNAPSLGKYFDAQIKGKYEWRKEGADEFTQ